MWLEIANLGLELLKAVAVVAAGIWAYWRFFKQRTHAPHIEFEIACQILGPQEASYVAEYTLSISNKGLVRQELRKLSFKIRGIRRETLLEYRTDRQPSLSFPDMIDEEQNLITPKFEYIFIEPGITQNFRHVSKIPDSYSFIQARAEFLYSNGIEHTASKVFEVKAAFPTV
jgi:hypothetical protein